jgi:thermostable 8-oxoguanine DNA glycosylase
LTKLAEADFELSTCSIEELESIWGIGPKTARFFVLFSRDNVDDIAVLDVHILRWLREQGYDVPKQTPSSTKRYREIELLFLEQVPDDKSLAQFDYELWLQMRQRNGEDGD